MVDIAVAAALVLVGDFFSFLGPKLQKNEEDDVKDVRNWLRTIQAYIKDMDGREGSHLLNDRISQVRDLAYEIEDVLDMVKLHLPQQIHKHRLSKFAHEIVHHHITHRKELQEIFSEVNDLKRKMYNILALDQVLINFIPSEEGSSSGKRMEDHASQYVTKEDEIVGFEVHEKTLIHHLVEGASRCMKIWVVGIGGSGKTTLVKKVYESKKVLGKYDCHAWIHVSRNFKIDELLWSMLKQFCEGREDSIPSSGADVGAKLGEYLQRKRYVVVLDDIWSKDDCERIVNALPESSHGSRIIVSTRKLNVAYSCEKSSDYILELKGLQWPHDWNLFCKKAFRSSDGKCPKELESWSQMILKKCEGLPLAIAAVGSLLAQKRQHPNEWKTLHDSLGSEIASDSSLAIISRVLLPSYKDLSDSLKSCLLYFSIFPEDYSIKRGRLIRLWVAEGFIKNKRGKTPEKVAEDYLNELIGRYLVHASAWDFDGPVSSCRVLNLVRELIILESNEENFGTLLTEPGISSGEKIRRLSINNSCTSLSHVRGFSCVRTLFIFQWGNSSEMRTLLGRSKKLRVLDLQGARLEKFPKEIFELRLLKYLSLRETDVKRVPKNIKKLECLETLDLRQTNVIKLPSEILELKFLRHLLVYRNTVRKYVTFGSAQGVEVPASIGDLSAVQKLSLIKTNKHRGVIKDLKKLIHLRKLGLIDLKREDGKALCESIQQMKDLLTLDVRSACQEECLDLDHMDHSPCLLQRLHLKGRLDKFPLWISSLGSLVRIGLSWSRLKTSPLEALQDLPNLVELLMVDSYTGEALEFKAETFKKLKTLQLEQFDLLNMVIVEVKAMPELAKLTICKCKRLEMLPLGISDLDQLEELLVYDMPENFIAKLQKNSEDRFMVDHIRIIHSFTLISSTQPWSFQNLS